jgi:hypothetical protein
VAEEGIEDVDGESDEEGGGEEEDREDDPHSFAPYHSHSPIDTSNDHEMIGTGRRGNSPTRPYQAFSDPGSGNQGMLGSYREAADATDQRVTHPGASPGAFSTLP